MPGIDGQISITEDAIGKAVRDANSRLCKQMEQQIDELLASTFPSSGSSHSHSIQGGSYQPSGGLVAPGRNRSVVLTLPSSKEEHKSEVACKLGRHTFFWNGYSSSCACCGLMDSSEEADNQFVLMQKILEEQRDALNLRLSSLTPSPSSIQKFLKGEKL